MSISDRLGSPYFFWGAIASAAAILAVVAITVLPVLLPDGLGDGSAADPGTADQAVAARVGDAVLLEEEIRLAGLDSLDMECWIEDELLAQLARAEGLCNPRLARFIERRASQLYARDALLDSVYRALPRPGSSEILAHMRTDSLAYLVERHYYRIVLADSAMADSVHRRLLMGENFHTTAQRLSSGQKAGLGGDLEYMVGGEFLLRGYPREVAVLDGLSDVYSIGSGYEIFLTVDARALEDTARVLSSLAEPLHRQNCRAKYDSLLAAARSRIEVEVAGIRR